MATDNSDGDELSNLLLDNAAELLHQKRRENVLQFRQDLDDIVHKYSQNFDDVGDEIDIMTGEVVVDRGHLRGMQAELDTGADRGATGHGAPGDILASVEPTTEMNRDGWETDESVDELSSEFFTTATRRRRTSRALSNKENLRPILGEVTTMSTTDGASPSPAPQESGATTIHATSSTTLDLNSQTISAVQSFLAMAKHLEPLLQAAVQPKTTPTPLQITTTQDGNGFQSSLRPYKRQRVDYRSSTGSESSHNDISNSMPHDSLAPNRIRARKRRSYENGSGSIWDPSLSEKSYSRARKGNGDLKDQNRPAISLPLASNLRNEILTGDLLADDPSSVPDSVSGNSIAETLASDLPQISPSNISRPSTSLNNPLVTMGTTVSKVRRGRPPASFTDGEDALLLQLLGKGHDWIDISSHFPGRSYYQVWYHHNKHLRPFLRDTAQSESEVGESTEQDLSEVEVLPILNDVTSVPRKSPKSLPNSKIRRDLQATQALSSPIQTSTMRKKKHPHLIRFSEQLHTSIQDEDQRDELAKTVDLSFGETEAVSQTGPMVPDAISGKLTPEKSAQTPLDSDARPRQSVSVQVPSSSKSTLRANTPRMPTVSTIKRSNGVNSVGEKRLQQHSSPLSKTFARKNSTGQQKRTPILQPNVTPTTKKSAAKAKTSSPAQKRSHSRISQFLLADDDGGDTTEDEDIILISSTPSKSQLVRGGIIKVEG